MLSSCFRGIGPFSQVAAKTRGSSIVVAGNSGFPQELPQGTLGTFRTAGGNQHSSRFSAGDAGFQWGLGGELIALHAVLNDLEEVTSVWHPVLSDTLQ